MNVLVTGAAGFIGAHVTRYLLRRGESQEQVFLFQRLDITDHEAMHALFAKQHFANIITRLLESCCATAIN